MRLQYWLVSIRAPGRREQNHLKPAAAFLMIEKTKSRFSRTWALKSAAHARASVDHAGLSEHFKCLPPALFWPLLLSETSFAQPV